MFNSSWPHGLQYSRLLFPPLSPRICQNSYLLNWWWHSTTSSSVIFSLFLESFLVSGSFPMSWLFTLGSCSHQYLSFSISPSNEYWGLISFRIDWFDLLALESPSTPQLKNINSSRLSLLYGPTLTSVHDYWKNHTLDYMDLCRQSDVSTF